MTFPLFFDEDVDAELAGRLQDIGIDVLTTRAAHRNNQKVSDEEQLEFAASEGRVLVTYNHKDFVQIARAWDARGRHHPGIIVCEQRPAWELLPRFEALFGLFPAGFPRDMYLRLPKIG